MYDQTWAENHEENHAWAELAATRDELAEAERAYWEAEAEGRIAIDIEERIWALEAALNSTKSNP